MKNASCYANTTASGPDHMKWRLVCFPMLGSCCSYQYRLLLKLSRWVHWQWHECCIGPKFYTVGLNWAGEKLGWWDELWYETCPRCRITHLTYWPAAQRSMTALWLGSELELQVISVTNHIDWEHRQWYECCFNPWLCSVRSNWAVDIIGWCDEFFIVFINHVSDSVLHTWPIDLQPNTLPLYDCC